MARPRTGTVSHVPGKNGAPGHYKIRVTAPDGSRPWVHLDPGPRSAKAEARAREAAAHYSELFAERGIVGAAAPRTRRAPQAPVAGDMAAWLEAWRADREARGRTSTRDSLAHYDQHMRPVMGDKHVRDWTGANLREVVSVLDARVQGGAVSWKTAHNVWATVTKMCKDACASKVNALRVRDDNPAASVQGPDCGNAKEKQYLYPSEFDRFVACEAVPRPWRRIVAVSIYTFLRAGELRVLRWDDVDLQHGILHVHRAYDRSRDEEKGTKGKRGRRVPIEPELLPLLRLMHAEAGGEGRVVELASVRTMARALRRWLQRADVERADLYVNDATRKAITFHDLRATGITWMAVRGDEPLRIQQRAGHTSFSTTQGYIRTAEELRAGFGKPFPALPPTLFGPTDVAADSAAIVQEIASSGNYSGVDGTRTRGLRRDRPAL